MLKSSAFGFVATLMIAAPAFAAPLTTQPTSPAGLGAEVHVIFIGSDAGDTSSLSFGGTSLFYNKASGTNAAASSGAVVNLGVQTGPLNFTLNDHTVGNAFDLQSKASDDYYHALVSDDYASLGLFALPPEAGSAIAALTDLGGIVNFIGFEDRVAGDYDYNDFVFAVVTMPAASQTPQKPSSPVLQAAIPAPVPEPASLLLMGAGLVGLAARRRRRRG